MLHRISPDMTQPHLHIRPMAADDHAVWRDLWAAYLAYYETTLSDEVFQSTWQRLMSGQRQEPHGFIAMLDGAAVGIAHFILHRTCWKIEEVCYLQDLFTLPAARGKGVARALIQTVYAHADRAGAPGVYWLTQEFNYRGRMLYDQVGTKSPFIRYNRAI
jgi:GNAT superfamily N-acetyltransferase